MPQPKIVWLASIIVVVLAAGGFYLIISKNMNAFENTEYCVGPTVECVGKKVLFSGTISQEPVAGSAPGESVYVNFAKLENKRFGIITVQAKTAIKARENDGLNKIQVIGTVVKVPQDQIVGNENAYRILVDEWKYFELN